MKELFPNAKISIDRFHLVQLINRSFNKVRIQIMNKHKNQNGRLYRKLKYYWKLLLKDSGSLNKSKIKAG
ncbi:transposase, partial [Fusobacterium sp.]|uniref:transposase n=1 Tax=Fusobacterium sp. TaxID=68766 RepID=UPI0034246169